MDSGASTSIIHKSYVNKNNFITRRISANKLFTLAGSFSTSHEAEITLKIPELNVTAHISESLQVTTEKSNYDVFFGRDLLRELGIPLDFQNDFIQWHYINLLMKSVDFKMRAHFTIQDSKNIKNANKRVKKILDANHEKANLKEMVNNSTYLNSDK